MNHAPGTALPQATPTPPSDRILILDSLRGIAILGILLMNIPGFALPDPVYHDPTVLNESTVNYYTWYGIEWGVEGSQRALFSLLFGAGIILFLNRQQKQVDGMRAAEYFFRRQLWLLVFGLINAFVLLWFWDILFQYAICGMILFAFYRVTPKYLLVAAGICLLLMTARENRSLYLDKQMISRGEAVAKIDTTKTKLTDLQQQRLGAMNEMKEKSSAEGRKKTMEYSNLMMTGSYADVYEYQSQRSFLGETKFTYLYIWDILLFMFIGMAFFKMKLIHGEAPAKVYWLMALIGFGVGLTVSYFRLQPLINVNFNYFDYVKNVQFEFYEISRTFRAFGFFGLIMGLYKTGKLNGLFKLFQPVGQMAFTNYLGQSLICGLIFYGVGFGMYGKLERYEMYYVVAAIYVFQVISSHLWLRKFRFGPLEWLWRSLTYWKMPSMKKDDPSDTVILKSPVGFTIKTEGQNVE